MYCANCENDLNDCKCEDLEKRLDQAVKLGHFDYNKCTNCGKHYARCKCKKPNLILASLYMTLKATGGL